MNIYNNNINNKLNNKSNPCTDELSDIEYLLISLVIYNYILSI